MKAGTRKSRRSSSGLRGLDRGEGREQRRADREAAHDLGARPALAVAAEDAEDEQEERAREGHEPGPVEASGARIARLAELRQRQRDRQQTDRHVDEEDPLPAEGVDEHAAEQAPRRRHADARPQIPSAVLRSRGANSCAIRASTVPNIAAPPIPCRPRAMLSVSASVANPAKSEAAVRRRARP